MAVEALAVVTQAEVDQMLHLLAIVKLVGLLVVVLGVMTPLPVRALLALLVHSVSFGLVLEHSHIWQESKEQSCLQKSKTTKWRNIR
jgi:hypothetical protein